MVHTETPAGIYTGVDYRACGNEENSAFSTAAAGNYTIRCGPELGDFDTAVEGPILTVTGS